MYRHKPPLDKVKAKYHIVEQNLKVTEGRNKHLPHILAES